MTAETVNSPMHTASSVSATEAPWLGALTFQSGSHIPGTRDVLKRALVAEVKTAPDGFVIRCGEVDEEAYGRTFEEAYFDFLTSLRDRLKSLSRREERLPLAERTVLERLRSFIGSYHDEAVRAEVRQIAGVANLTRVCFSMTGVGC